MTSENLHDPLENESECSTSTESKREEAAKMRVQLLNKRTAEKKQKACERMAAKRVKENLVERQERMSKARLYEANLRSQQTHRERSSDMLRKRLARQSESETETLERQSLDRSRRAQKRQRESEAETLERQSLDRSRTQAKRQRESEAETLERQSLDRSRKKAKRQKESPNETASRKRKDRMNKANHRQLSSNDLDCISRFHRAVKDGPVCICTCCKRLLYRSAVVEFKRIAFKVTNTALLDQCVSSVQSVDGKMYICKSCSASLHKNDMPPLSTANGLEVEEIPEVLKDLSSLECVFISQRIPFMKILGLPRGQQKSIHGAVVNVQIEPEECVSVLPRIATPQSVVPVKLKRKLEYRGHCFFQNVRPHKIMAALQLIKHTLKNPLYSDVVINVHWEEQNATSDQELWDTLTAVETQRPCNGNENNESTSHFVLPVSHDPDTSVATSHDHATQHDMSVQSTSRDYQSQTEICLPLNSTDHAGNEDNISHSLPSTSTNGRKDDSVDDDSDGDDENETDERLKYSGLPLDTCMMPRDATDEVRSVLEFSPGEGKKPMSFASDEKSEELSFPQLFPSGKFGFSAKRAKKLSPKKYFKARLLHSDGRFSKCLEYLFYSQYRCEAKDVYDCMTIATRKGKSSDNMNAGEIKNNINKFLSSDLGIHFMKSVRGSPAYYHKLLLELLAMVRTLGPCTYFVTLSSADLKWPDMLSILSKQQGKVLTEEEIKRLNWHERCKLLRDNPVTAARHFDYRLQQFMKHILLNKKLNPLGEVTDYKYRIEMQSRGSCHAHMVVFVKNAPSFETHSEEEVAEFVSQHVTCSLPENDDDLRELLQDVQTHHHSKSCKKHGDKCRFHFPRPLMTSTTAFLPPDIEPSESEITQYKDILQNVYEVVSSKPEETLQSMTVDDVLEEADVDKDVYTEAVRWAHTRNGQPAILLERSPSEMFVNNYNPTLMRAWQANLDVQFVSNVYSCIMYVASYMSKPEKTMGDLLKGVSKSGQQMSRKECMQNVARKFLSHREVSAQEAAYRVLGLPLTQTSRQILFLPTNMPEDRTRYLKSSELLEQMEDDNEDIFYKNILDRYAARPDCLESLCLAEFASQYTYCSKHPSAQPQDDDIRDEQENPETATHAKKIQLKDGMGFMRKKKVPAIIRTHQFSQTKQPNEFCHAQLLLYFPWRKEVVDLCKSSYEEKYAAELETIQKNRVNFEHHSEEVEDAYDHLQTVGVDEQSWVTIAAESVQQNCDDGIVEKDNESMFDVPHSLQEQQASTDTGGSIPTAYSLLHDRIDTHQYLDMVLSLNQEQREIHDYILQWCYNQSVSHREKHPVSGNTHCPSVSENLNSQHNNGTNDGTMSNPEPFYIFMTGGAGCGKSHVVRTIVQTATRVLCQSPNDMPVCVTSYTGSAAFNIGGTTCHSAFLLPFGQSKNDDYICLTNEKLTAVQTKLSNLQIVIIDEISMLGADLLLTIHRRLCEIKGCQKPFGGVSVLAVGDLFQLPPVAQKPVFSLPSDEVAAIYGSLWQSLFVVTELTTIMRQEDGSDFAQMLNRVRKGNETEDDIKLLKTRVVDVDQQRPYAQDVTHAFMYNKLVDKHNQEMLLSLSQTIYNFEARDGKKDSQTGRISHVKLSDTAGGLPKQVKVAIDAKVMLTRNMDVSDGLVNCATGIVRGFIPAPDGKADFTPKYILIEFTDQRVGAKTRASLSSILPHKDWTPISTVHAQVPIRQNQRVVTASRTQFPLTLAWAVTIHKEQGKTEETLVVSCEGRFRPGMFYTAISRTKTLEGLHLLGELPETFPVNHRALSEMDRMQRESPFRPPISTVVESDMASHFKLSVLNINSFNPHQKNFLREQIIGNVHAICLTETWLLSRDETPELSNYQTLRQDCQGSTEGHRQGGLLLFLHSDLKLDQQFSSQVEGLEHITVTATVRSDPTKKMALSVIYRKPSLSAESFLQGLELLFKDTPLGKLPTVMCGDMNVDLLAKHSSAEKLKAMTSKHNLQQHVQRPTQKQGGLLDHVYSSFPTHDVTVDVKAVPYSDHCLITSAVDIEHLSL